MPGTPPLSPRVGAPRIANTDDFDIAGDLNAVTDAFDAAVALKVNPVLTALPGAPYDGQEILFRADGVTGIVWALRYNPSIVDAFKWEPIGGMGALRDEIAVDEQQAAGTLNTWGDLGGVGPQITLPLAGHYEYVASANVYGTIGGINVGLGLGGANPAVPDFAAVYEPVTDAPVQVSWAGTLLSQPAGRVVKMMYQHSAGTVHFRWRKLFIRPTRVG